MTFRYLMTRRDPRQTDFVLEDDLANARANLPVYTSNTTHYSTPRNGSRATTTVIRTDPTGDVLQVGVIEWPARIQDRIHLVVGTRNVQMTKSGLYTAPERFTAADGYVYEWQIHDAHPQLVSFHTSDSASSASIATFHQSRSGFLFFRRRYTSSLFVSPMGFHILDDIVVTFIYFECKWLDKENTLARISFGGSVL